MKIEEKGLKGKAAETRKEKRLSDHRYYASEMKLASLDWDSGQPGLMLQPTTSVRPAKSSERRTGTFPSVSPEGVTSNLGRSPRKLRVHPILRQTLLAERGMLIANCQ